MDKAQSPRERAGRNRTITLSNSERKLYRKELVRLKTHAKTKTLINKIVNQDILAVIDYLPWRFVDLLILDPPYNLSKTFGTTRFRKKNITQYAEWFENLLTGLLPLLKETASVYVCSEWQSSTAVHMVLDKHLKVRNRITWQRDKGRGSKVNWKNASEDIWFATVSNEYTFNIDAVKVKRRVIAPYTDSDGRPKDWHEGHDGRFRLTGPSNLWNDITVPFWSMPENTDHPTQKPEKLMAKLILAGTKKGDFVFDPFMGTGSSVVTAAKLGRRFLGVEVEEEYCLLAAKRLQKAKKNKEIQGYNGGVFWERNTLSEQKKQARL